ncbi:MAG: hypothetical protein OSJ60_16545 [Lachnospiraceae bacterium]|nr:hypothetical protein [Lachnospiraceae bacterium]
MKKIETLEAMAEKKRESIKLKQQLLKKDIDKLKDIEAEIEILKGEEFRKDINKLNLTPEEYEKFRLCLADKDNLLDVINRIAEESRNQKEGVKPLYE